LAADTAHPEIRVPRSSQAPEPGNMQQASRNRVHRPLRAPDGHDSAPGWCAWHVPGSGWSLREWALRQGWGGRPVRQEQAQGMFVAALGLLSAHYRLAGRAAA
jgi:hypothetical protein